MRSRDHDFFGPAEPEQALPAASREYHPSGAFFGAPTQSEAPDAHSEAPAVPPPAHAPYKNSSAGAAAALYGGAVEESFRPSKRMAQPKVASDSGLPGFGEAETGADIFPRPGKRGPPGGFGAPTDPVGQRTGAFSTRVPGREGTSAGGISEVPDMQATEERILAAGERSRPYSRGVTSDIFTAPCEEFRPSRHSNRAEMEAELERRNAVSSAGLDCPAYARPTAEDFQGRAGAPTSLLYAHDKGIRVLQPEVERQRQEERAAAGASYRPQIRRIQPPESAEYVPPVRHVHAQPTDIFSGHTYANGHDVVPQRPYEKPESAISFDQSGETAELYAQPFGKKVVAQDKNKSELGEILQDVGPSRFDCKAPTSESWRKGMFSDEAAERENRRSHEDYEAIRKRNAAPTSCY